MKQSIIFFLIGLPLMAGCKKHTTVQTAMPVLPVQVAVPQIRTVTLTKEYPGYLVTDKTVNLVGRVNGALQSINFTPGARVKAGQLLFVIEPAVYRDAVLQAEAELRTAQATLEYNQSSYERMKEAVKSNAVSRIQVQQAESSVAQAKAAVSNAEAQLSTARTQLSYCYVKAPFDGTISKSSMDVGNYVSGSLQPVTLATIYKDDRMYAYFNVADNQWLQMKSNRLPDSITVRLGQDGPISVPGRLDYLSPNVDLSTGTLSVRANLDNPDGLLKSGLYVTITLPYAIARDALLVREASIGTDQLGKYLYIVNDSNRVEYRHITAGQLINDTLRQVLSGVTPGEKYVTQALLKVREGQSVKPVMGE